jgi:hypothetical protein
MSLLAHATMAPLRAGAQALTLDLLYAEPLLFAAHYATVCNRVIAPVWPDDIAERLRTVGRRYQAHDAVLKLMDTLRGQLPTGLSVDLARRLAEGLELHTQLDGRREIYQACCQQGLARIPRLSGDVTKDSPVDEDTAEGRLATFCCVMVFSDAERRLLAFTLVIGLFSALQLFVRLLNERPQARAAIWQAILDLEARALKQVLAPTGALVTAGLLQTREGMPRLSEFWADFLIRAEGNLVTDLVQPLEPRESTGGAARLPDEDRDLLHQ